MPTHNAVVLRVSRNLAGVEFPWDRVYFFRRAEEQLLPQFFPCALITPLSKRFVKRIKKVQAKPIAPPTVHPYRRKDEKKLKKRVERRSPLDVVLGDPNKYIALVPILHLQHHHGRGKVGPVYLTARPKLPPLGKKDPKAAQAVQAKAQEEIDLGLKTLMRDSVNAQTYFIVEGEKIKPVCVACPNNLEALNGRCHFGQAECYELLARAQISDFRRGLKAYQKIARELGRAAEEETTDE